MDSCKNIIDLNLDVLDIIFSKLYMEDQINLGCAHPNLREGFLRHNKSKLKKIYLAHYASAQWDSLLSLCGFMVESIVLGVDDLSLQMNCAAKHCTALQKIVVRMLWFNKSYNLSFSEFTNLKTIKIAQDRYDEILNNLEIVKLFQSMQELPNLRTLHILQFPEGALNQIRELTQLEDLSITNYGINVHINIMNICATLNKLRVLDVYGNVEDEDSFQTLPQFCPLLENLCFVPFKTMKIPYFPKLKELKIHIRSDPIDQALGEYGHRYAKQFDKLTIHTDKKIENSELLEQLRGIKDFKIILPFRRKNSET